MKDNAEDRNDFAPPTAQFAVREAKTIAKNIEAVLDKTRTSPFSYTTQGSLASLGARRGVAQIWGMNFSGFFAWILWRAYYVFFLPGLGTKIRVLLNWLLDAISSRSVVQTTFDTPDAARYVHFRAGDRVFEKGNRTDGVYTIIQGKMELTYNDATTGDTKVSILSEGDHFGERIILGDDCRAGTVKAVEDSKVLVLGRDEFLKLAEGFPVLRDYFENRMKRHYGIDWKPPADSERTGAT